MVEESIHFFYMQCGILVCRFLSKHAVVDDYDEPEQAGSWSKWDSDHVLGLLLSLPIV